MTSHDPSRVQINRVDDHAACVETSERLCATFGGKLAQSPPRLANLAKILDRTVRGDVVFGTSITIGLR